LSVQSLGAGAAMSLAKVFTDDESKITAVGKMGAAGGAMAQVHAAAKVSVYTPPPPEKPVPGLIGSRDGSAPTPDPVGGGRGGGGSTSFAQAQRGLLTQFSLRARQLELGEDP